MRGKSVLLAWGMVLCTVQSTQAQGFNRRYDATGYNYGQGTWGIENAENGWLVFSVSYEPDTILPPDSVIGSYRIILQRVDEQGVLVEEKRHLVPRNSLFLGWADCCDSVVGGGYVTAGSFAGLDIPDAQARVRLMRYDANGDTLWTRTYGDSGHFMIGNQVKQTADGGFLVVGWTGPSDYYDDHGFAIKTDSLGNELWRHNYGPGGTQIEGFSDIAILPDGYLLAGQFFPAVEDCDFIITRISDTGTELWSRQLGSAFKESTASVQRLSDGRLLLSGGWASGVDLLTPYLAFLDSTNGEVVWDHLYGLPGYSKTFFATKQLPNTELIACGVTYDGGYEQGLLLRTTADGDSLWMRSYAYHDSVIDQGQGRFWDVLPTADGGCIAAGFANNPFNGPFPPGYSQDAWVVKVDSMGCIVPGCDGVGITEQVTNLAGALQLWPNPVSGQLHVGFSLPGNFKTTGPLMLSVTTLDGRLVLRQQLPPLLGRGAGGEGILDVSALAPGTYALHLSDGTRWLAGSKFVVQ